MENNEVEKFLTKFFEEGAKVSCDDSQEEFKERKGILPDFYDDEKFKRGQKFFQRNLAGMCLGMYFSLAIGLSVPSLRQLLMFTQLSGTPLKAFKRYLETIYHVILWNSEDFSPGSKLWKSVEAVRCRHNCASKKGHKNGIGRISQMDMGLTQIGFFGMVLMEGPKVGVHDAEKGDLEGMIHVWRVIGHVLGVDERFNICRDTVEETAAIVTAASHLVLKYAEQKEEDFLRMADAFARGMRCMVPRSRASVALAYAYYVTSGNARGLGEQEAVEGARRFGGLSAGEMVHFRTVRALASLMRHAVFRWLVNCAVRFSLWMNLRFPVGAYLRYGAKNVRVEVLNAYDKLC